jgi:hypothetical protein
MNKRVSASKLLLNLDKRKVIKLITKNLQQYPLHNGYNDKYIRRGSKYEIPWLTI